MCKYAWASSYKFCNFCHYLYPIKKKAHKIKRILYSRWCLALFCEHLPASIWEQNQRISLLIIHSSRDLLVGKIIEKICSFPCSTSLRKIQWLLKLECQPESPHYLCWNIKVGCKEELPEQISKRRRTTKLDHFHRTT